MSAALNAPARVRISSGCCIACHRNPSRAGKGDARSGGVAQKTARSAAPFVPASTSVKVLSAAAQQCRGCDLYKAATQVVFGAGPGKVRVMLVGEQPGDQEDRQG